MGALRFNTKLMDNTYWLSSGQKGRNLPVETFTDDENWVVVRPREITVLPSSNWWKNDT
jgi:hypothetical protein